MSTESRKLWARTGAITVITRARREMAAYQHYMAPVPRRLQDKLARAYTALKEAERALETWPVTLDERAAARAEAYSCMLQRQREEAAR